MSPPSPEGAPANPVAAILRSAAEGRFPPPDAGIDILGRPPGRCDAVLAFTAHHIVATGVPEEEVRRHLPPDPFTGPMSAGFLQWLGEALRTKPGMVDVVLAAQGLEPDGLGEAPRRLDDAEAVTHPRAARAARYRTDLAVYEDRIGQGVLILGLGLAGRWEVAIEVDPEGRGTGLGRALAAASRFLVPPGEPVFAQVSPGNAASLRAFLAAGFAPIGAEVLFLRP